MQAIFTYQPAVIRAILSKMWRLVISLTIFFTAVLNIFSQTAVVSTSPTPPPFQSLRYEEDYSYLKNKENRKELSDKIKYIPLGKEDYYVSLGGEARIRYETYKNVGFGFGVQDKNGYLLQRYLLHADWHFGKRFRVFTQLQSGFQKGRNGGSRSTDDDFLDLHQAFIDAKIVNNQKRSLMLRIGRQEIEFGSGRLISASEGLNVRRSFDAVRLIYKQGKWTTNTLFAKLVSAKKGFFDDIPQNNLSFWGLGTIRSRKNGGWSIYYLGLDRKAAQFNQQISREVRQTFGSRTWGNFKKLDYNYEAIAQLGTFGNTSIQSWAFATETGFNFPKQFSRIALKSNITSGDNNQADKKLQSFNPLFPATAYSGTIALIGPTNTVDLSGNYRLNRKKLTIIFDSTFYWRQSRNDGLYGIAGNLQRNGNLSHERYVGNLTSLRIDYKFNRNLTWTAIYSHFTTGKFLKDTPPSKNVDYFTTWMTYRF
jgi:hypothetical protein